MARASWQEADEGAALLTAALCQPPLPPGWETGSPESVVTALHAVAVVDEFPSLRRRIS